VYEGVELQVEMPVNEAWHVSLHNGETSAGSFEADFMVDASGSGRPIASAVGIEDISDRLKTRTGALFGHFEGVASAVDLAAASAGLDKREYLLPFSADDAAQHHLLGQDVWCWMLRFLNGRTSVGIVGPESNFRDLVDATARQDAWRKWIDGFPPLAQLLTDARLVAPTQKDARGIDAAYLGWRPRISRCWAQAAASPEGTLKAGGWAMLPSTVGVIDPLHSTGIAHSLSGVDRLASALLASQADAAKQLRGYSRDVVQEVLWIDEIVSVCRLAQSINFEAFTAASAFYFVAAIHSERQLAGSGELPTGFLLHADERLRRLVSEARHRLLALHNPNNREPDATRRFVDWLRYQLADWNDVGLLDPALKNRIARAAAPK
jgi:FADH2 O2-dependent halogenase